MQARLAQIGVADIDQILEKPGADNQPEPLSLTEQVAALREEIAALRQEMSAVGQAVGQMYAQFHFEQTSR